jgi:hypothetical protein
MKRSYAVLGMMGVLAMAISVSAAPKKHAVRLMVKGEVEKKRESSKKESDKSSTKYKTETQFYDLQITAANTIKQEGTFDLEWYFFKRDLNDEGDKSDPVLCEKDKTTLTIAGMKRVTLPVKSSELSWSEIKTSKSSSGNSKNSGSSGGKSFSGSLYEAYVVLVKYEGQIIAKYSDEKKFLTPEWIDKLDMPVQSGSKSASKSKKKKK